MTRYANNNKTIAEPASQRAAVHCYLTQSSHDVIHSYAEENGVSVTSLVEAMCEALSARIEKEGMDCDPDWVRRARRIDAFRRRRG